ncbi:MAG: hypothetical protein A2066_21715 [Bacteroidetes bacterium GWB2_41_8]|nr:MAG: hypothetical protein A2066_21715 [Bacteroidetes bacterium GWB2_41_8]
MTILQIKVTDRAASIVVGGDMAKIAREIGHLALEHEEFALALNQAMIPINEELECIRLRDEMIGMIKNP